MSRKALLVIEDGRVFTGTPFGAIGQTLGEAVFSTGMSGKGEAPPEPSARVHVPPKFWVL